MCAQTLLHADPLPWLLEDDNPGVRYLALRDLCALPATDPQLDAARELAHRAGPIATVLDAMDPQGFWEKPGAGYGPKYRSAVWSLILLAELGASIDSDVRIATACRYLLDHALAPGGQFSYSNSGSPSGTIDCLQGNLCWALTELGCEDPRLAAAYAWMARTVTGEGIAPAHDKAAAKAGADRFYAYKCGPCFACGVNGGQACAWGAVKVMLALAAVPPPKRTPEMVRAIAAGIDFLLAIDPATAAYPTTDGKPPSRSWWSFGFPVFYVTDLLQLAEALVNLGCGADPRLGNLLALIASKQDAAGRWKLEYVYGAKTWGAYGRKGQPNKWVTLRAARVLQRAVCAGRASAFCQHAP
jgi:hypothetical protein